MKASRVSFYKGLFLIAAIYDISLGIIFTFFHGFVFELFQIPEKKPEFGGYVSLIGAFLFVIGVAYYLIYRGDLRKNRDLIMVGTLYKLSYSSLAFYFLAIGNYPHIIFIALFGVCDLIFFVLMMECLIYTIKTAQNNP